MWVQPWLLVLFYAVNQGNALGDDGRYGKDKAMTRLSSVNENTPDIEEVTWTWNGVLKSMFSDEKDTCLTLDILGHEEAGSKEFPSPGTKVGVFRCPGSVDGAPAYQRWFIKGRVYHGLDVEPVFEGVIRSDQVTADGRRLCLSYINDPARTPLASWQMVPGEDKPRDWHPQAKYYDWRSTQGTSGVHPMFWNHHKFYTTWGRVFVDYCKTGGKSQTWWIGLSPDEDGGKRRFADDPVRWTWIRPMNMPWRTCDTPQNRDTGKKDDEQPEAWCIHRQDSGCKPNYPYHPGLMRPYIPPDQVDDQTKVQWVMLGCSPTNWMPQLNFGLLNSQGEIKDAIVGTKMKDPRIPPGYVDWDFQPVELKDGQTNFEPVGQRFENFHR
ncbi:hypothetical protein TWF718_003777 [Orbilia javanica]|uniref:Uncharacterized protein n=1 Tax=Orbilia javanica TaxID=47235 RepID=A0AAN8RKH4_9PEZI